MNRMNRMPITDKESESLGVASSHLTIERSDWGSEVLSHIRGIEQRHDGHDSRQAAVEMGVIVEEDRSRNTRENAEYSVAWMREQGLAA
jgi:hypothetical protein